MGKCSVCDQSGHNRRSCLKQPTILEAPKTLAVQKSHLSTDITVPSSSSKIISPQPLEPPLTSNTEAKITSKISSHKAFENKIKEKEAELIKKLDKIPKQSSHQTISNFCNGCNRSGHLENSCPSDHLATFSRYNKTCGHCGKSNHNWKTCPELKEKRAREKADKEDGPAYWLLPQGRARFKKGPTEKDGPGFIYIYTYQTPTREDKDLYKIGMSEKEDGRRRVEVQEKKNKEKYQVLFHDTTPYRYLTENVIHLHLKEVREPREYGDGKTEWFRGDKLHFIRVVKDVIREVRFAVENGYFKDILNPDV